jgi:hypothetical protein
MSRERDSAGVNPSAELKRGITDSPQRRFVTFKEVGRDDLDRNSIRIAKSSPDANPIQVIRQFQSDTHVRFVEAVGVLNHGVPLDELGVEYNKYGLDFPPVIITSSDRLFSYAERHDRGLLALLDIEGRGFGGIFLNCYDIAFVNYDIHDKNSLVKFASHESGGHGNGDITIMYYDDRASGAVVIDTETDYDNMQEAISEWRGILISESVSKKGVSPPSMISLPLYKSGNGPVLGISIPSKYIASYGNPEPYSLLATCIDMLVARDPNNPDAKLFKAFFYGNTTPTAYQTLKGTLDEIDPRLFELFDGVYEDFHERHFGREAVWYIQRKFGRLSPQAAEQAASVTSALLPTLARY